MRTKYATYIYMYFTIVCYDMVSDFYEMLWDVNEMLWDVFALLREIEMKGRMIWNAPVYYDTLANTPKTYRRDPNISM